MGRGGGTADGLDRAAAAHGHRRVRRYEVPIADPAKPLNFIVHRPSGDSVPSTREPGGNRSFVPAEHDEIWLKQGDPAVYFTPPG